MLAASALLLSIGYYVVFAAPYRSQRNVAATVALVVVENHPGSGLRTMHIEADTDTGRRVLAGGRPIEPPRIGERILLRERISLIGFHSYFWEGLRP